MPSRDELEATHGVLLRTSTWLAHEQGTRPGRSSALGTFLPCSLSIAYPGSDMPKQPEMHVK
jgi:hypothetical protein